MNYSVIYSTMSGHSRKIAKAIGELLNCQPEDIKYNPEIFNADYLFIVTGIYGGKISDKLAN